MSLKLTPSPRREAIVLALKDVTDSLHLFLGNAYTYESNNEGARCKCCGELSPLNADRKSCRLVHADSCTTKKAISAERKAYEIIAQLRN